MTATNMCSNFGGLRCRHPLKTSVPIYNQQQNPSWDAE